MRSVSIYWPSLQGPNSGRDPQCSGDFAKRCLLCLAHRHAANAKKSAFVGCLGNVLADLAQPAFECGRITWCLRIDHGASLPLRLDALGFDLSGLAACKLFLQAVARGASPLCGLKIGDDCPDEQVRARVHLGRYERTASGEAFLQKAPQPAWPGSRDSDARHHHTFQNELPFVGGEVRLVRHGPTPLLKSCT